MINDNEETNVVFVLVNVIHICTYSITSFFIGKSTDIYVLFSLDYILYLLLWPYTWVL
ncbi:hypothetical protein DFJ43DRAFT_1077396, partial [Lentinula guzmanii]